MARPSAIRRAVAPAAFLKTGGASKSLDGIQSLQAALKSDKPDEPLMFCYQCEQTMNCSGCSETVGVCGKTAENAALQDLLVYQLKGLGYLAHYARQNGVQPCHHVDSFLLEGIFSTLTNVDFDDMRFVNFCLQADKLMGKTRQHIKEKGVALPRPPVLPKGAFNEAVAHPALFTLADCLPVTAGLRMAAGQKPSVADMVDLGHKTGIHERRSAEGTTLVGLQELVMYGLKGLAAYAHHAEALGHTDKRVFEFVAEALHFLGSPQAHSVPDVLAMALKVGESNLLVMEMLSNAHSTELGVPTPTTVTMRPKLGKAILVSGHDMHDLHELLKQTEGTGINVYTHGEMLPAHGYPVLKKFPHLAGHFGGAWYRQKSEFSRFPGPIVMTTNCVMPPSESYRENLFTLNAVGVTGSPHLAKKDFSLVIKRALEMPGFDQHDADVAAAMHRKEEVTVGFGHNAVLGAAPQVISAIQEGRLEHIFLIGGCDGSEPQRKYYADLFKYMPQTTMVLTLGCGKFRIFDQDFGMLPPAKDGSTLPRLLDMGQCNDAYSAIVVAKALASALNTDINSLPLSLDLSWFEQKAVAVLLTLLHLGVRNIRLGPRLPAFLTQDAVNVLVEKFNLIPAQEAELDVKQMMTTGAHHST